MATLLVQDSKEFYQLKFTHFNAQGLTCKFAQFKCIIENDYDLIAVSETWLDDSVLMQNLFQMATNYTGMIGTCPFILMEFISVQLVEE